MNSGKFSETKLPIFKKLENSLTQRFGKHSIPRKLMQKNMYVERALLRESRQFSKAKNKYTTNMLENSSLAEQFMNSRKSEENYKNKEHKMGILTPLSTMRFENADFSNPDLLDPRLKTLSAAGLTTSSEIQLIYKELGNHRKFTKTEMGRPNLKLLYTKDPNNKTLKAMQNITKNLNKLNQCRDISSQRDLNKKLLSAPSNISRNYDKSVNKEFNESLTMNHLKPVIRYDGIESGSPERRDQRLARMRKDYGFVNRNGTEYKTFADMETILNSGTNSEENSKFSDFVTAKLINQDQRINYLFMKEGKHKPTDTLGQRNKKPVLKQSFQKLFKTSYNCSSESNIIWSEKPISKELNFNNPSINYDPCNTQRILGCRKDLDFNNPRMFTKINGISEFNQITHPFNSNHNKDYVKALEKNKHFRKSKGMCAEFLKLAKFQPR